MRVFIHTCVQDAHGARREYQILLEMGFHVVVSCLMCTRAIPGSSARAAYTLQPLSVSC